MTIKKTFVKKLLKSEIFTLEQGHKYGKSTDFRQRCQILLISNKGYEVKHISKILEVNAKTVYATLKGWREKGLAGIMRKKGQGRKSILELNNPIHVKAVKRAIEKHYPNKTQIIKELYKELGITQMSTKSLDRFLKKLVILENNSNDKY